MAAPPIKPPKIGQLLGAVLCVSGWGLAFSAHKTQKKVGNDIPFKLSTKKGTKFLCTTGPYKYSRNPFALGSMIGVCTSTLLIPYRTPLYFKVELLLVSVAMISCGLYCNYHLFPEEERYLEEKHGETYLEYKRNVNRWFGRSRLSANHITAYNN